MLCYRCATVCEWLMNRRHPVRLWRCESMLTGGYNKLYIQSIYHSVSSIAAIVAAILQVLASPGCWPAAPQSQQLSLPLILFTSPTMALVSSWMMLFSPSFWLPLKALFNASSLLFCSTDTQLQNIWNYQTTVIRRSQCGWLSAAHIWHSASSSAWKWYVRSSEGKRNNTL